jgi:hypothetical protein
VKFVQIVEFRTSRVAALEDFLDAWIIRTEGERVPHHAVLTRDRDTDHQYLLMVEFASHEQGMDNSSRPATAEFATFLAEICDGPPSFRNLDVLRDDDL